MARLSSRIADAQIAWDKESAKWLEGYHTDFNGGWVEKDEYDLEMTYEEYAGERPSLTAKTDSSDRFVLPSAPGRDAEILRRHEAGEPHPSIAEDFRISRERVRQIVGRGGGIARRSKPAPRSVKLTEKKFIAEAPELGMTANELASRYAVSLTTIYKMAKSNGIRLPKKSPKNMTLLKRAAGDVLMGKSYYQAAYRLGLRPDAVRNYCLRVGVRSSHCARRD